MSVRFDIPNSAVLTACLIIFSSSVKGQYPKSGEYRNWIPADVGYYSDVYRECLATSLEQKGFYTQKIFSDCRQNCAAICLSDNQNAVDKFHSDNNLFSSRESCLKYIKTTEKYSSMEKKYQKKKAKNKKKADKYLAGRIDRWCNDPNEKGKKGGYHRVHPVLNSFGSLSATNMLQYGWPDSIQERCRVTGCADDRVYTPSQSSNNLNDRLESIESMLEDLGATE